MHRKQSLCITVGVVFGICPCASVEEYNNEVMVLAYLVMRLGESEQISSVEHLQPLLELIFREPTHIDSRRVRYSKRSLQCSIMNFALNSSKTSVTGSDQLRREGREELDSRTRVRTR